MSYHGVNLSRRDSTGWGDKFVEVGETYDLSKIGKHIDEEVERNFKDSIVDLVSQMLETLELTGKKVRVKRKLANGDQGLSGEEIPLADLMILRSLRVGTHFGGKSWKSIAGKIELDLKEYLIGKYHDTVYDVFSERIQKLVNKYLNHLPSHIRNNEKDDLGNIAKIEFLACIRAWEPDRNNIWPFAYSRISGAMRDHLRFMTKADPSRIFEWITNAANLYMSINSSTEFHNQIDDGITLNSAINELSPMEQKIVIMRYKNDLTFKEIGDVINLSDSQVSRIYKECLKKLKKIIKPRD